jgi:DNA polymerase-3 subunit gamma/tau
MAMLISSLNILNEAEINYKAARNKRLHVELVLIKLCYLQQAIEITSDSSGLSKKKLIESARPVAFRQISPIEVKGLGSANGCQKSVVRNQKSEAKLIIENSGIEKIRVEEEITPYKKKELTNEQPTTSNLPTGQAGQQPVTGNKISALDKIRKQYKTNGAAAIDQTNLPLEQETLQTAWNAYIQKLRDERNPAVQPFELAQLIVKDDNCFEVITSNNIEQKFIEQERNHLFAFLQQQLKNRLLQFNVVVNENNEERPVVDAPLSSREQFIKMTEQYPLLKELKDRLRLDLDY